MWPAGLPAVPTERPGRLRAARRRAPRDRRAQPRRAGPACSSTNALGWGDALVEGTDIPASLAEVVAEHRVVAPPRLRLLRPDTTRTSSRTAEDELEDDRRRGGDEDDDADDEPDGACGTAAASDSPWKLLGMWVPWGSHPLVRTRRGRLGGQPRRAPRRPAACQGRPHRRRLRRPVVGGGVGATGQTGRSGRVGRRACGARNPRPSPAFVALLARRRFLGVAADERLPALLERSAEAQEEVTVALGDQVRAAVEMLVDRLDDLDRQAGGAVLAGVSDDDLYAGVVTVMMRVLFLLFAEERRLLPSDDDRYDTRLLGRPPRRTARAASRHPRRADPRAPQRRLAPPPRRRPSAAQRRRPRGPPPSPLRR